jgi:hypothetical protein
MSHALVVAMGHGPCRGVASRAVDTIYAHSLAGRAESEWEPLETHARP